MFKYKYLGTEEIDLIGYGPVKPGEVIETETPVNNPLFEPIKKESQSEENKKIKGKSV